MTDEERTQTSENSRSQLEEKILTDHPRLGPDDNFKFAATQASPASISVAAT
jgi:hypothetical protein